MTILRKLTLALGAIGIAAVLLLTLSISGIRQLELTFSQAVSITARKLELSMELDTHKSDMYLAQRGLLIASFAHETTRYTRLRSDFENHARRFRELLGELKTLDESTSARAQISVIENSYANWTGFFGNIVALCDGNKPEEAQQYSFVQVVPVYEQFSTGLKKLATGYRAALEDQKTAAADLSASLSWELWTAALVLALSGAGTWWIVFRMNRQLRGTIRDLDGAANQVAGAATQVTAASQGLAEASSRQAASLEETSSSSREINAVATQNATDSGAAAGLTVRSQDQFVEVNRALKQMVEAMNGIGASSDKISRIIRVIDEIAFQTNILALNAAVEAARAGEAGLGFSVVADEVRNLAQRCAQAAKDTSSLIEESIATSGEGRVRVDQVAAAIGVVNGQIAQVRTLVENVSSGSKQQANGIAAISGAINDMERITQASAATAEESAAAAEELTAQSQSLRSMVKRFAAMVGE